MRVRNLPFLAARLGLLAWLTTVPFSLVYAQGQDEPIWPTQEWQISAPEEQGMDSSALAKIVARGEEQSYDSLVVIRHGRIVTEAYYAPYTADIPHNIFSSTKAVTGTLVGMALKDGLLDRLDHPVLEFFGDRRIANVDAEKKAMTVQSLLDMTSGLNWDQGFEGGDQQSMNDLHRSSNWTQFILDRPMAHPPGEVFNYNNGNVELLSAIITRLTGKLAEDYAREKLFGPLGIVDWHWDRDPQGLTKTEGILYLLPRDMAKLGYLYLHHGEWEGKRLLAPGWADVLDHPLVNMHASHDPSQSYSNLFWVFPNKHVYMTNGKNGQLIVVFPERDVVAVTTARKQLRLEAFIDAVSAAVKSDSALPPNPDAVAQLVNAIKDAATEKRTLVSPTPEIASVISGKTYKFPDNAFGLRSITLDLIGPRPHFEVEISLQSPTGSSVTYSQSIGLDGLYRKSEPKLSDPGIGHVTAAKGAWSNAQTFVIDAPVLGFGEQQELILSFSGKKLKLRRTVAVGEGDEVSLDGEQSD